jgi:hypothetical protein
MDGFSWDTLFGIICMSISIGCAVSIIVIALDRR